MMYIKGPRKNGICGEGMETVFNQIYDEVNIFKSRLFILDKICN